MMNLEAKNDREEWVKNRVKLELTGFYVVPKF